MFVLLKLLLLLFRPVLWIFILIILALVTKNLKLQKQYLASAFIFIFLFSNPFILRIIWNHYEEKSVPLESLPKFNAGIVLGGFVSYEQKERQGYFNNASDRFIETALLYQTGHIKKIIVAGGNGNISKSTFTESSFARQKLVELGIPYSDILYDTSSRNTLENAIEAKKIVDNQHTLPPFLLITSAFHMKRARALFEKAGLHVTAFPCDFLEKGAGNNFLEDYLIPSSVTLFRWEIIIKEWLGLLAYKLTGKI